MAPTQRKAPREARRVILSAAKDLGKLSRFFAALRMTGDVRRYTFSGTGRDLRRAAFTLVEALLAISIAALAASALLLGTGSSMQTTDEALKLTIASGMAQQLMDEVVGQRYCSAGFDGHQWPLGCNSWEAQGTGRERYDDIDDYNGVRSTPPKDLWGVVLGKDNGSGGTRPAAFQAPGGYFDDWQQEIDVYYVSENDTSTPLPNGQVSDYRVVEVRVVENDAQRGRRELVKLRRVVAYVPLLP